MSISQGREGRLSLQFWKVLQIGVQSGSEVLVLVIVFLWGELLPEIKKSGIKKRRDSFCKSAPCWSLLDLLSVAVIDGGLVHLRETHHQRRGIDFQLLHAKLSWILLSQSE